jgi:PA domain
VEALVVYAHFGREEDFAVLREAGVSVEGRVVLVRLGKIFRGVKVSNAQTRGAHAVLMYSDPADGGSAEGAPYPEGVFRPDQAVARGNVRFGSVFSGDSSTPGWASVPGAFHLSEERVRQHYLPLIPVLPVSALVASRLMQAVCEGDPTSSVVQAWIGGLDTAYCTGPSLARAR